MDIIGITHLLIAITFIISSSCDPIAVNSYDNVELCGYLGGTCRPLAHHCSRELQHKWGVPLCGRSTDRKCCADRVVVQEEGAPANACQRSGGTCQAWYQPCQGSTDGELECGAVWHSCCMSATSRSTDYTGQRSQANADDSQSDSSDSAAAGDRADRPAVSSSITPGQCGQQMRAGRRKRVIGGSISPAGLWPWQVGIKSALGSIYCGGTIIADRWIVTAAHCFKRVRELSYYRVVTGPAGQSQASYTIKRIIKHHLYENHIHAESDEAVRHAHKYDIALVELERPLQYTSKVQPACLPAATDNFESKTCWLIGWGSTQPNEEAPDSELRHVRGQVLTDDQCRTHWGNLVDGKMLCFGNEQHGACRGDSGGGLFCQNSDGFYALAGVISWGSSHCNQRATVLTDITQYRSWIDDQVSGSSSSSSSG